MKKTKIIQLFETYGDLYQPYIPPVIDTLKSDPNFDIQVEAFKRAMSGDVQIIPSYYKRRFHEHFRSIIGKSFAELSYLEQRYLKNKVDIIHLQHSFLYHKVQNLLTLPKLQRPKIIITLRGADTYVKPWLNEKWRSFYAGLGQSVDAFVVMSVHQKQYLHRHWNIALEHIYVIPISFGFKSVHNPKTLSGKTLKIASAFRMCWEKNIEGNLRVIKNLRDMGLSVTYNLFGDGPDSGQVYYLIDKYELNDCVNYHGRLANADLKTRLLEADFYLQLSHSESLGMSVIEAQSQGVPAIVSDSDGLPEVVVHGVTGYCVKPYAIEEAANYILQLWNSSKQYHLFSKEAINHCQSNFSVENEVDQLSTLYKSLITQ